MKKQIAALGLCAAMVVGAATGCSATASKETEKAPAADAATTAGGQTDTTAAPDTEAAGADQNDMVGKFQEKYPDAEIEVEKIKDDSEYWNAMKMRTSANQLPDVMFNKPFTLSRFKDYLVDLSDLEATKNNELAAGYALDGKILGVPLTAGYEYVFYWKDMFK